MGTFLILGLNIVWFGIVYSASACYDGDRVAIDGSCKSYLECKNGNFVVQECGLMHSFDPVSLECRLSNRVKCTDKAKECTDGKKYPHPSSCKLYYDCYGGRLSLKFCPLLEVFDQRRQDCSFGLSCGYNECTAMESRGVPGNCKAYQICDGGKWTNASCPPLSNFHATRGECALGTCSQCSHGDKAYSGSCNSYQSCQYGIWQEEKCSMFQRFDPSKKKCVWMFQYTCPESTETFLKYQVSQGNCEEGKARAETDCKKYSICQNNVWLEQSCPEDYLYDSKSGDCKEAEEAVCGYCTGPEASATSCSEYTDCENGQRVNKKCGWLQEFDGVSKECVYVGAHCFPGESCSGNVKRALSNCHEYEECLGGRYYKNSCGLSRFFDSTKGECVWALPWESCPSRRSSSVKAERAECSEGERRLLSCEDFVECRGGRWEQRRCPTGQTFNGSLCLESKCQLAVRDCRKYSVNGVDLECSPEEYFDQERGMCRTGQCNRARRAASDACEEGATVAVENSCKEYRICKGGEWQEKKCSDCQNFNQDSLKCSFVWEQGCVEATTTPQPTTSTSTTPTPITETTPTPTTSTPSPITPTSSPITPTPSTITPTSSPITSTPSTITPTSSPITPTPTPCIEGTKQPNPSDCKQFYVCEKGVWTPEKCSLWRKFDAESLTCVNWGAHCAAL